MKVPLSLLSELEKLFPPRCIGPSESIREADRYAGKVELVALLRDHFNAGNPEAHEEVSPKHVDPTTGVRTYDDLYGDIGVQD